jgi:ribosomal protein L44E
MTNPDCTTPLKRCTKCGNEYPATPEFFHREGKQVRAYCKSCSREYNRKYRAANLEHRRDLARAYRDENVERARERNRKNYIKNIEHIREYRATHTQRAHEYQKEYRQTDKGKAVKLAAHHRRRARKLASSGTYTLDDIAEIRAAQTDKKGRLICWKCGKPITDTPHLDHWIPLEKGGTNDPGNLHYMHARCNLEKGAKLPAEVGRLL